MKNLSLLALLTLILTGCATTKFNYIPKTEIISKPPVDSVNIVQIGDYMIQNGSIVEYDALKVESNISITSLGINVYTIGPGFYKKCGEDQKSEFYLPYFGNESGQITKAALCDPWKSVRYTKDNREIGIVTIFGAFVGKKAENINRVKKQFPGYDSFVQTLIYSGKVGNIVKIGYREFSNSMARPAFSNEVQYDLTESNIIGYKGARIEVIEATNQTIKYKILQGFTLTR